MALKSGWDTFRLWPVTQNEFAGGVLPFYAVLHCFASRVGAFLTRDRSTKPKLLRGKTCLTTTKGLKHLRNKMLGQTISNSNRVAIFCLHANVKTEEEARVRWLFKHRNYSKIRNTSCTNKFWTRIEPIPSNYHQKPKKMVKACLYFRSHFNLTIQNSGFA